MQIRAENAAIQDELRKLEGRDRMLLLQRQRLQRECGGSREPIGDRTTNHAMEAPILWIVCRTGVRVHGIVRELRTLPGTVAN